MQKFLIAVAVTFALAFAMMMGGCKTNTPQQNYIAAEGVVITTVDSAMRAWAGYVNAGHATQAQVDTVRQAYNAYYTAQLASKAAFELSITTTNQLDLGAIQVSAQAAENSLLNLLITYLK